MVTTTVSKKKLILIIVLILVVLAGIGVAGWYFLWPKAPAAEQQKQATTVEQATKTAQTAQDLATNGKPEESYALLDAEIEKTSDKPAQAVLYKSKANIARDDKNAGLSEAIKYALEADTANPTSATAAYVGSLYELNKDIPNAIRYYQLAYDREPEVQTASTGKSSGGVSKRPMYQAIIEKLKSE